MTTCPDCGIGEFYEHDGWRFCNACGFSARIETWNRLSEDAQLRRAVEGLERIDKTDVRLWRNAGIVNWYTVPSTGSVASYWTLRAALIALAAQIGAGE